MSTVSQTETFLSRVVSIEANSSARSHAYYSGEPFAEPETIRFHYVGEEGKPIRSERRAKTRVLRRFQGFLIEVQGPEARVAFIHDGKIIQYDLPARQLQRSGITDKNQPFQMDEIEMPAEGGGLIVGYHFLPL